MIFTLIFLVAINCASESKMNCDQNGEYSTLCNGCDMDDLTEAPSNSPSGSMTSVAEQETSQQSRYNPNGQLSLEYHPSNPSRQSSLGQSSLGQNPAAMPWKSPNPQVPLSERRHSTGAGSPSSLNQSGTNDNVFMTPLHDKFNEKNNDSWKLESLSRDFEDMGEKE